MSSYQNIASFYDYIMRDIDYDKWLIHYLKLLSAVKPCRRILEAGCGTGNFTFRLGRFYDVHGVEISPQMLKIAENKEKSLKLDHEISFECSDICHYGQNCGQFDAAVAAFDVMNCIINDIDLEHAYKALAQNIRPGGILLFDVNTEYAFNLELFNEDIIRLEDGYSHVWRGYYDPQTRLEKIEMKYYINGKLILTENQLQRAFTQNEITQSLKHAGFDNVYFYDAWTLKPAENNCDRWLISASKL